MKLTSACRVINVGWPAIGAPKSANDAELMVVKLLVNLVAVVVVAGVWSADVGQSEAIKVAPWLFE